MIRIRTNIFPLVRQFGVFIALALSLGLATLFARETSPATSDTISKEIIEAFHFSPKLDADKVTDDSLPLSAPETLTLEKFVVTHYNDSHKLELLLTEQAKRIREESFSWKDGGTIFKKVGRNVTTELKLKFNHDHRGFDVINFAW